MLELPSSFEVKGIVGNDKRRYALDLFRIFPPDANYMEVPEGSKVRHRMAVLRPELVETFHKYVVKVCIRFSFKFFKVLCRKKFILQRGQKV